MPNWKRVKIDFKTVKLGDFIVPVKTTVAQIDDPAYKEAYGVTNTEGIVKTGKKTSADISKYIIIDKNSFAYNPYRINVGSVGANFHGIKGCVSPAYVVFKTKEGLNPLFLWYYLKSDFGNHLINWYGNRGGVRNALRYDDLCKIDIPDINYEKQLQVISTVDHFDKKISKINLELENQQSLLKQLRQAVLQEAVQGKLTADWRKQRMLQLKKESGKNLRELRELLESDPDYSAKALLEKIKAEKALRHAQGAKSTMGTKRMKELPPISDDEKTFDLPEGWVWCRLGEIIYKFSTGPFGTMLHKSDYVQDGIPLVNPMNIVLNKIVANPKMMVNQATKKRLSRYILDANDIVLARRGDLSKCAVVSENEKGWLCGTGSFFIKISDFVNQYYFVHAYISNYFQKELLGNSIGQTMNNLNQTVLKNALFAIPPLAEQQAIVGKVDRLLAKIDALEEQVKARKEQAEQLMQAVLREAFNGEG